MLHRAPADRIQDILHAIARVAECIEGMTFDTFAAAARTVEAVPFNLVVIGGAARQTVDLPPLVELLEAIRVNDNKV